MRPDSVEPASIVGYLGGDGVLYCSRACAVARGQVDATPVDQDQHEALAGRAEVERATTCPVCGSEFRMPWPAEEE
jgi:hypothetical protein